MDELERPSLGPPWDLPIGEAPFAFLDLEMTGLDVAVDRVVEVCVDRVIGGERVGIFTSLVNPGVDRVGGSADVHGLDASALLGAPSFGDIALQVKELLEGAVIVAHAASWDVAFLDAEFERIQFAPLPEHYLDTLVLARRAFSFPSNSMDALCTQFQIPRERAHRAGNDVAALRIIFERCVAELAPVSVRDLWEVRLGGKRARASIVAACVAAAKGANPTTIVYRPARRAPLPLTMMIQEVRVDCEPARVLGYELPSRARRELRADRILRVEPVAPKAT